MDDIEILTPLERRCTLVAGILTSAAILAAALTVFVGDGDTPWFAPGGLLASAAEHCEAPRSSAVRHDCLRRIAEASRASAPLAVAGR